MNITNQLHEYYKPLLASFVKEVDDANVSVQGSFDTAYAKIPEVFLPAFGTQYEQSLVRIAFIGRDTLGWGKGILQTLDNFRQSRWDNMFDMSEFQSLQYLDWSRGRYTFWGFALYVLAWLYDVENWELLKRGNHSDILRGFAWGNVNSIERMDSGTIKGAANSFSGSDRNVFWRAYDVVKRASRSLDDYRHFANVLAPHVVFMTCGWGDCQRYLKNSNPGDPIYSEPEADLRVFEIGDAIIINMPHPQRIMYRQDNHKADYYAKRIREILEQHNKMLPMKNEFISDVQMSKEFLSVFANQLDCRTMSTCDAVKKIAIEMRKQDACMTVRFLCEVLNSCGFRTNYNEIYRAGRGSYRMLSWFYRKLEKVEPESAEAIAMAFKNPNGDYAYA